MNQNWNFPPIAFEAQTALYYTQTCTDALEYFLHVGTLCYKVVHRCCNYQELSMKSRSMYYGSKCIDLVKIILLDQKKKQ